jgi:segregation and condensation protein A
MPYRVNLEIFRGPLDLLLYLVRKHEVEITEIPIALITDQYLQHLSVLEQLDVNAVGDFLVMASTLMEIKSRELLPRGGEVEEELEDPRQDLVRQLLEYKKYRDAASILEERRRSWQERFCRVASDLPPRERDLAAEPIREVELWDLVSAFSRVIRDANIVRPSSIVYDDTPIQVYMERIYNRLRAEGRVRFDSLFEGQIHKSAIIGMFLAVLELARHYAIGVEQDGLFGQFWLVPQAELSELLDFSSIETYEHPKATPSQPADEPG